MLSSGNGLLEHLLIIRPRSSGAECAYAYKQRTVAAKTHTRQLQACFIYMPAYKHTQKSADGFFPVPQKSLSNSFSSAVLSFEWQRRPVWE